VSSRLVIKYVLFGLMLVAILVTGYWLSTRTGSAHGAPPSGAAASVSSPPTGSAGVATSPMTDLKTTAVIEGTQSANGTINTMLVNPSTAAVSSLATESQPTCTVTPTQNVSVNPLPASLPDRDQLLRKLEGFAQGFYTFEYN
jgi:hypothetical protein